MLFDNVNWNSGNTFQIPGNTMLEDWNLQKESTKFLNPEEGFLKGNILKDEYDSYKKMTFLRLKPESEKERMLFKLMAYCFALNDLNLYLDLHPEDNQAFELFKKYAKEELEAEQKYSELYGPITITETQGTDFNWIKNPWPWDKIGESNYV